MTIETKGHRAILRSTLHDGQRDWDETRIRQEQVRLAGTIGAYVDGEQGSPGEPVDCQPSQATACHTVRIEKLVDTETRSALRALKATLPLLPRR